MEVAALATQLPLGPTRPERGPPPAARQDPGGAERARGAPPALPVAEPKAPPLLGELLGPDGRKLTAGTSGGGGGTLTGSPGYRAFLLRHAVSPAVAEQARQTYEQQLRGEYVQEQRTSTLVDVWV